MHRSRSLVTVLAALLLVPPAAAQIISFTNPMSGLQVVAPVNTGGVGQVGLILNTSTRELSWQIKTGGLTGGMTTAIHFHQAKAGQNGPVELTLHPVTPSTGMKVLTVLQMTALLDNQWYADVHTTMFAGGEIRGQCRVNPVLWAHLPVFGVPGTDGLTPRIAGSGPLTANSDNKVTLDNAKPNAMGILYIATSAANKPFKGGTMVPDPAQLTVMFQTDAQGMYVYSFKWPAGIAKWTNRYWQAWVMDNAAAQGTAGSNALRSTSQG